MKGAVVYYSRWGTCKWLAEEIVAGLREEGHEVCLMQMNSTNELGAGIDFLVVGSPMQSRGLALPAKRFIKRLDPVTWQGKPFAAFGTTVYEMESKGKIQAAEVILEALTKKGLRPVAPPFKALLTDIRGPLVNGEFLRALGFGRQVGVALNEFDRRFGRVTSLESYLGSRYAS